MVGGGGGGGVGAAVLLGSLAACAGSSPGPLTNHFSGCVDATGFLAPQRPPAFDNENCLEFYSDHTLEVALRIQPGGAADLRGVGDGRLRVLSAEQLRTTAIVVEPAGRLTVFRLSLAGATHGFIVARLGTVRVEECLFLDNTWLLGEPTAAYGAGPASLMLSAVQLSAIGAAAALFGTADYSATGAPSSRQVATLGAAAVCLLHPVGTAAQTLPRINPGTISNKTISDSMARTVVGDSPVEGSAVQQTGGQLSIVDSVFNSNFAADGGAVAYSGLNRNDSIFVVQGSTFDMNEARGNAAAAGAGHGGAILVRQTLQSSETAFVLFVNSTFTKNLAKTDTNSGPRGSRGGAIYIENAAVDAIGCNFEANGAYNEGTNKAVYKATGGAVAIEVNVVSAQWNTVVGGQSITGPINRFTQCELVLNDAANGAAFWNKGSELVLVESNFVSNGAGNVINAQGESAIPGMEIRVVSSDQPITIVGCNGLTQDNIEQTGTLPKAWRVCSDSACEMATHVHTYAGLSKVYQTPCNDDAPMVQCSVNTTSAATGVAEVMCAPNHYGSSCVKCEALLNCSGNPTNRTGCEESVTPRGRCVDDDEGFKCECGAGFDGLQCDVDEDECASLPCQNSGICVESTTPIYGCEVQPSVYRCDCAPGWMGHNCMEDIDECASNPCQNKGICVESNDLRKDNIARLNKTDSDDRSEDNIITPCGLLSNDTSPSPSWVVPRGIHVELTTECGGPAVNDSEACIMAAPTEAECPLAVSNTSNATGAAASANNGTQDKELVSTLTFVSREPYVTYQLISDDRPTFEADFKDGMVAAFEESVTTLSADNITITSLGAAGSGVTIEFKIIQGEADMEAFEAAFVSLRNSSSEFVARNLSLGGMIAGFSELVMPDVSEIAAEEGEDAVSDYCRKLDMNEQCVPLPPTQKTPPDYCCPGDYFEPAQKKCLPCKATTLDNTVPINAYSCSCKPGWAEPCRHEGRGGAGRGADAAAAADADEGEDSCKEYYFGNHPTKGIPGTLQEKLTLCIEDGVATCSEKASSCEVAKNECVETFDDLWKEVKPRCKYGGTCTSDIDAFSCACANGYSGADCTKCEPMMNLMCNNRWVVVLGVAGAVVLVGVYSIYQLSQKSE